MSDKVIVTNKSQLKKKCGPDFKNVTAALNDLIKKDKQRNIATVVVYLDDKAQMKKLKSSPVTSAASPGQDKKAINEVYKKLVPDYIMILGATDVIPHQDLTNPKFSVNNDPDRYAYGDIPYACNAPYSKDPAKFRAPTRVVGRLPDLVAGESPTKSSRSKNAKYLVRVLRHAANYRSRPPKDREQYLGISASVWKGSTRLSLQNMFGSDGELQLSPPKGARWRKSQFQKPWHYINCHGAPADPYYYGQKGDSFPIAHSAKYATPSAITNGTVAAAECCYGAELYDPGLTQGQPGICNTYLASGAYAFFGSTTIAYGPEDGNGAADLITQFFIKHVLAGASVGRAALQARQDFIKAGGGPLDPVDLKTLAQFNLIGDPSIHPIKLPVTESKSMDVKVMKGLGRSLLDFAAQRTNRRRQLVSAGLSLLQAVGYAGKSELAPRGTLKKALSKMANNLNLSDVEYSSFDVRGGAAPKAAFMKPTAKRVLHMVEGRERFVHPKVPASIVMVAEEQAGKIVSVRTYHRK